MCTNILSTVYKKYPTDSKWWRKLSNEGNKHGVSFFFASIQFSIWRKNYVCSQAFYQKQLKSRFFISYQGKQHVTHTHTHTHTHTNTHTHIYIYINDWQIGFKSSVRNQDLFYTEINVFSAERKPTILAVETLVLKKTLMAVAREKELRGII